MFRPVVKVISTPDDVARCDFIALVVAFAMAVIGIGWPIRIGLTAISAVKNVPSRWAGS